MVTRCSTASSSGIASCRSSCSRRSRATSCAAEAAAQVTGAAHGLKAGEYAFPSRASLAQVIRRMRRGEVVHHRVTLPEGVTAGRGNVGGTLAGAAAGHRHAAALGLALAPPT